MDGVATSASVKPHGCSSIWKRGSAEDCVCIFGDSGRMGPNASRSCAVEVLQGSLLRSPRAHRRGLGECQDIPRFKRHYATTYSILSACLASTLRIEAQPGRTAEVRDPYARWCGRGGAARRPPIPIIDPLQTSLSGLSCRVRRSASGRRGAVADDVPTREV